MGCGGRNRKKYSTAMGRFGESRWRTFLRFWCFVLVFGTISWGSFVLKYCKVTCSKRGPKNLLPSLCDHFDRCFTHTTGEGLHLWFLSLIVIFWRVEPLDNGYVLGLKKIPCGAIVYRSLTHPSPRTPYRIFKFWKWLVWIDFCSSITISLF